MLLRTRFRLLTRNRNDWAGRFPSAVKAIQLLKARSCLIDGEMVVCNDRGLAVFDLLRRGPQVKAGAFLYAFDLLELDGRDLQPQRRVGRNFFRRRYRGNSAAAHVITQGLRVCAAYSSVSLSSSKW
jgi:ATP-dependent DNA ligase